MSQVSQYSSALILMLTTIISLSSASDYSDELPFDNTDRLEYSHSNRLQALLARRQALNELRRRLENDFDDIQIKIEKRTCKIGGGLDRHCAVEEGRNSANQLEYLKGPEGPGRRRRRTVNYNYQRLLI